MEGSFLFSEVFMCVNRNYKSTVFSDLFSDKEVLRELYSAIEGISIPPDIPIEINTLSNALIKGKLNDVSFLIDNRLVVLVEHQSTVNHNMPLRLLEYIADIYKTITDHKMMYNEKLIKIPKPEFIVLYNGKDSYPERAELRLSKAFKSVEGLKVSDDHIPLELVVQVYNINHGQNPRILKKCSTLDGYSTFIAKINENTLKNPLEKSVKDAIKYCIEHNILKEYLEKRGLEVINMLYYEYDQEVALEVRYEEGREDREEEIARNLKEMGVSPEKIQLATGLPLDKIEKL
jgi:predicted transposase/invertase (TIGR01784 family)